MLESCASVGRVKQLETRMDSSEARTETLHTRLLAAEASAAAAGQRVNGIEQRTEISETKIAALEDTAIRIGDSVTQINGRVGAIEKVMNWSGKFRVTILSDGSWHSIYANSTAQSQRLRIRRISQSGEAQVRIGEISRSAGSTAPQGADLGITTGVIPPSWDMSSEGSQRWHRIGCGQEISGRAPLLAAKFEVLVTADPQPVRC
jgi:hypothetical protein